MRFVTVPHVLRFRPDETFVIVQFTDLHWSDGGAADRCTLSLIELVLDAERPDLVVLTGDVIDGACCADPATAWRAAVEPMESRGVAWAAVFGNHDDDGSLDRRGLMALQQSCRLCLSEPGPAELPGVGNFVLPIRSSRGEALAAALLLLDSGSYAPDGNYAWVTSEQIDWFRREISRLRASSTAGLSSLASSFASEASRKTDPQESTTATPVLTFLHIPFPEFATVWENGPCRGSKLEDVCCPVVNSGLFAALCDAGGVLGVFAGHDHINDYEGTLGGIRLCYGRATGYGTYGHDGFARGARVIRLIEGRRDFDTWLRLDDGSLLRQVESPRK